MEGKEKYILSLKDAYLYSHGSYKISFCVKSKESVISINVKKENVRDEVTKENFVTEPIEFTQSSTDIDHIKETQITVDIDKDVYKDPTYLHVEVLKLISDSGPSNSNQNDYQNYCEGKVLLQPRKCIFQEVVQSTTGSNYSGSLNLFTLLEHGHVRVVAGWIKYSLFFTNIEEVEEAGEEEVEEAVEEEIDVVVNEVEETTDIGIETIEDVVGQVENTQSPEQKPSEEEIEIGDEFLPVKHETPINNVVSVLELPLKESHIDIPVEESRLSANDITIKKEESIAKVETPKRPLSLQKSPEAPLSCSDFICDLPNVNAIKYILPKYHALQNQHGTETVDPHVPIKEPENGQVVSRSDYIGESRAYVFSASPQHVSLSPHTKENLDAHVVLVLDYQSKELDRYRGVIQRMGSDIMQLRQEISELHGSKNQLVRKLYYAGEVLPADGNDSDEITQLKRGLVAEHEVKSELQQRVHNLQNQLIKKTEIEASYVQLQQAHHSQQKVLQDLQNKMAKYKLLQETVKNQELVIEKLEKQMNENNALVKQPSVLQKERPQSVERPQQSTQVKRKENRRDSKKKSVSFKSEDATSDFNGLEYNANFIDEKLRLLQRVEQSERTVCALEEQLYNNSMQWAKERSAMQRSMLSNNHYSPQKLLASSRSYDQNMNYSYHQPRGAPHQNTLQFPPYTYQHPMNNHPWNVP